MRLLLIIAVLVFLGMSMSKQPPAPLAEIAPYTTTLGTTGSMISLERESKPKLTSAVLATPEIPSYERAMFSVPVQSPPKVVSTAPTRTTTTSRSGSVCTVDPRTGRMTCGPSSSSYSSSRRGRLFRR